MWDKILSCTANTGQAQLKQLNVLLEELQTLTGTAKTANFKEKAYQTLAAQLKQLNLWFGDTTPYLLHRIKESTKQTYISANTDRHS